MRQRKLALILILLCVGSTGVVFATIQWQRSLGGNLKVLVASYGAELYSDAACTQVANSVPISPVEQGKVGYSTPLYLKNVGGGRLFVYWEISWLSSLTVPVDGQYSPDGHSWQNFNEGPLNFHDLQPGSVIQVRWLFKVPAGQEAGSAYQYSINLKGSDTVPSA